MIKQKTPFLILASLVLLGCTTLKTNTVSISQGASGIHWTYLNADLFTQLTVPLTSVKSGNKQLDAIYLKSTILVAAAEQFLRHEFYLPKETLLQEINTTIAQIDSIDPINLFNHREIKKAAPAAEKLLQARAALIEIRSLISAS